MTKGVIEGGKAENMNEGVGKRKERNGVSLQE